MNEKLQSQIDSLSNTMLNFRRKQILAQNQIEKMVKIKSELECSLTEKEHQLNKIKEKLLIKNISDDSYASLMDESLTSNEIAQHQTKLAEPQTKLIQIDPKDPNRPRFTLKELEKVLIEKNELTIKLDQTQDELEQLRKQFSFFCLFFFNFKLFFFIIVLNKIKKRVKLWWRGPRSDQQRAR